MDIITNMSSSDSSYPHMDLYKQLHELTGSTIRFKATDGGEYEGVIDYLMPKRQCAVFEHVYYFPTKEYMGNLRFSFREFISYSVVKGPEKVEKWDYLSRILDRNFVGGNKYRMCDVLNQDLDEESVCEDAPCAEDFFKDDFVLNLPGNLRSKLPHDSLVLESIDTEFHQAVRYISQQKVIGVAFEGPKISRLGKLSWVCISTPYCIFLFDIELLGKDAFDKGLRNIFQDKTIEKVIHDCRQPSDCLSHLFSTELINVFDTQVADYIVNMQRYSDKPALKYVSSLDSCLVHHLDVPQDFLFNRKKYLSYHDEVTFFRVRPISNDYRDVVIKNTVYLVLLKETLTDLMLNPFHNAVDVYLKVLANASEPELLLDVSVPEIIPPALIMEGIQTVRFQEISVKEPPKPLECKFKDSTKGAIVNYDKMPYVESKNICSENLGHHTNESDVVPDKNFHKSKEVVCQNFDSKSNLNSKSVIIDQMIIQNSKKHMDNVYHHLVNSLGNKSKSVVDVKPSHNYVSNFVVKSSLTKSAEVGSTPETNSDSDSRESELNNSWETLSECSEAQTSPDVSTDSSDTWIKLHSVFGVPSCVSESEKLKKYKFLPAGMYA